MHTRYELKKHAGRTFDAAVLHGGTAQGVAALSFSLFEGKGAMCTGIQKLVQKIILFLLTPVGSLTFAPNQGSSFLRSVSFAQTEQEVQTAFSFAVVDLFDLLRTEVTDTTPLDEQLASITLVDVSLFGTTLSLAVSVVSKAGTLQEVILPVYT